MRATGARHGEKGTPTMVAEDLYALLGVGRNATDDELKQAYRKKARLLHPDANGGDREAEARFKEVTFAYDVLRDPDRRRQYDRFGIEGIAGSGATGGPSSADAFFAGGLGDLFETFFGGGMAGAGRSRRGGPMAGADAEVTLRLAFREAVFGAKRDITVQLPVRCETCHGAGARPGTTVAVCPACQGNGEIRRVRQSILGQVVTAVPCGRCHGSGESIPSPCPDCSGEGRRVEEQTLTVEVPVGVDDGATLRLAGRGPAGLRGGPNGSLFVHLAVQPDDRFERQGADLHAKVHVGMAQAALGAPVTIETLEDPKELNVVPGTQSGQIVKLKGLGVPHLRGRGRGDLYVHVIVDTPTDLDSAQEELLRRLAEMRGEEVGTNTEGLLSKLRSALG